MKKLRFHDLEGEYTKFDDDEVLVKTITNERKTF